MAHVARADHRGSSIEGYGDLPSRSPWVAQLAPDGPPRPLEADAATDVVIVGAGIAGVATAFFTLRSTPHRVMLIERDRVARGATGHNAGQLTTYFERPLYDIADAFGWEQAIDAQRAFDAAHELLDLMTAESGATVRVERFTGHMGMFTLNHLQVHLRNNLLRQQGGLRLETCVVSEEAEFLEQIPAEYASLYRSSHRRAFASSWTRMTIDTALCSRIAKAASTAPPWSSECWPTSNSAIPTASASSITRAWIVSSSTTAGGVAVHARGHVVAASSVVLCTNGYVDHVVEDATGACIVLADDQRVTGTVGYMAAFVEELPRIPAALSYIRNTTIGGDTPYVYVTRRTYDRADSIVTLTCMGGPEHPIDGAVYDPASPFGGTMLSHMDQAIRPYAQPARPPGRPYDFQWHGLMGYTEGRVRVIGRHPGYPGLLYNLGCNGVGFLPSICGGERVARILSGEQLSPSIFDPR